jgi:ferritin-like metal-binding protein YciE
MEVLQNTLYDIFLYVLRSIYDAENQIIDALPNMIKTVQNSKLREAISQHLSETINQVKRLKLTFVKLSENPTGVTCKGMQGILAEGTDELARLMPSVFTDVFLITVLEKLEYYEISSYGSAIELAENLQNTKWGRELDLSSIISQLEESLEEEQRIQKKLKSLSEGGLFSTGINEQAEELESESDELMEDQKRKDQGKDTH